MEPRYLTYVVAANLLVCGCWNRVSSDEGRLRPGDGIFVSVVTQLGATRPCVGRDLTVMLGQVLGRLSRGVLMWQWEVPWPDNLLEIQRNNTILYGFSCRTYHSLMVAPQCLDGSYSRHKCEMPMLAKIYIFTFEMFYTLCTSNNIKCFFLMRIKHL